MSDYATNVTYEEIAAALTAARRVGLTTHRKPDGDAIGSVLALARGLATRGIESAIHLVGPVDPNLLRLAPPTPVHQLPGSTPEPCDLLVVCDTGAWSQLDGVEDWIRAHGDRVIGLDHHPRGDAAVAARRIVDAGAASTSMLILELFEVMGVTLDGEVGGVAEPLFLGLATDTGWFRHDNADARAFGAAARLLATGVDRTRLYQIIEESHRPARLSLAAAVLSSLAYAADGAVAIMCVTAADFARAEGSQEDLTGLVNWPLDVARVQVSVLLTEVGPGRTKLSFRSKPNRATDDPHAGIRDVNLLAQTFDGGGHVHAAGARVDLDVSEAAAEVCRRIEHQVGG